MLKLLPVVRWIGTARIPGSQGSHLSVMLLALDYPENETELFKYSKNNGNLKIKEKLPTIT